VKGQIVSSSEVERYGCQNDGLGEADMMIKEKGGEGGRKGGKEAKRLINGGAGGGREGGMEGGREGAAYLLLRARKARLVDQCR